MKNVILFLGLLVSGIMISGCATNNVGGDTSNQVVGSPTNFYQVTSKLDKGGEFYLYVDTEDVLSSIDSKLNLLKKIFLGKKTVPSSDEQNIKNAFVLADNMIKNSGVKEIGGVGSSSIKIDKNLYRNVFYVYHKAEDNKGVCWSFLPINNKPQRILGLLPKNTGIAMGSDFKLNAFKTWIEAEIKKSNFSEISKSIEDGKQELRKQGIDIDKIFSSINGGYSVMFTLDKEKKSQIPVGFTMLTIPRPAAAIVIEVSNDYIFNLLGKSISMFKVVARKDSIKQLKMALPPMLDIDLAPTILQTKSGLLIIASNDMLANEIVALDKGEKGLLATESFKKLAKNIPLNGNSFHFISEQYSKTLIEVEEHMFKGNKNMPSQEVMNQLNSWYNVNASFMVIKNTPTGLLGIANAPVSQKVAFLAVPVAVPAIAAGMLLPALNNAREKARTISCASNLKQIGLALKQYSMDYDDHFPKADNWVETLEKDEYLSSNKLFSCPSVDGECSGTTATCSYNYFGDLFIDNVSADIPLAMDKIGNHKNYVNVLFMDGHVKGYRGSYHNVTEVINQLNGIFKYKKKVVELLLKRAKELDEKVK